MNVRDLFPSKYVTAEDLAGRDHTVTIAGIRIEDVGKEQEQRPVVYFAGQAKGMVLNRTNAKRISETYGADTDRWVGQQITLYPSETDFGGESVPCIRIRPPQPAAAFSQSFTPPPPAAQQFAPPQRQSW